MSRKEQQHGGVKLTAKTARTLAMQEFGTARGLTKSTPFVGVYFMEFGNLRIEICADAACIVVRVVLAHGTGSSVKYFDPDTLQENFKAIDKHREDDTHLSFLCLKWIIAETMIFTTATAIKKIPIFTSMIDSSEEKVYSMGGR